MTKYGGAFSIRSKWPAHRGGITRMIVPEEECPQTGETVVLFDPEYTFTQHLVQRVYDETTVAVGPALPWPGKSGLTTDHNRKDPTA